MQLETYLSKRRAERELLLMTHVVLGYPSFDTCRRVVCDMAEAGVDLVELQIPFSEPIADGPVILRANQLALDAGARVEACLELAEQLARELPIPCLLMTYYNIPLQYGLEAFAERMRGAGLQGAILPDLPPEEADPWLAALEPRDLAPIFIFSPSTPPERLQRIADRARGFVYCVARKGVTGAQTEFADSLDAYLARCRQATSLPLAVGFGVRQREDLEFLRGKADIAVVGTQSLRVLEERGVEAVGGFIRELRG